MATTEQKTAYVKASELADKAYTLVQSRVDVTLERAVEAYDAAIDTIEALKDVNVTLPADITFIEYSAGGALIKKEPHPEAAGLVAIPNINDPGFVEGTITPPTPGTAPTYVAPIVNLTVPVAPAPINLGTVPVAPILDYSGLVFPPDPVLAYPTMGPLTTLTVPSFVMPAIPTFSEVAPTFTAASPGGVMPWTDPDYAPEILDEVKAVIFRLMDGNAIPAPVEQALWDRARQREDVVVEKAVADAYNDWAGRGFTMPPGMLVEQVNVARQDASLKTNTLSRDVAIKHAEWMQENVRFSVVQGLAYEQLLINIWENALKRTFEMQKLGVEISVKLYEVQVSIFNATVSAYKIKADVWKIQIDAVLTELQAYKVQLDAEKVKGEINEQEVRIFTARMNALQTEVDIYKAEVSAVQTKVDTIKTRIDAYKVEVDAYNAWLDAQKTTYEAYDIQVRAENTKASLLESTVRAFAAEVQAFSTVEEVGIKRYEADARVLASRVDAYSTRINAERTKLDGAIETNKVILQEFANKVDMYRVDMGVNSDQGKLDVQSSADYIRNRIAYMDTRVREWQSKAQALMQQADLQARSLQAAATASTGLANATMSAVHYNAGYSGGGTVSASHSESYGNKTSV